MVGKPKYKDGDIVSFTIKDKKITGEIYIVDKYGTWENPYEVSYDILVNEENRIYKHISEDLIQ